MPNENSTAVDLFKTQYEKLSGKVYLASNVKEAIQFVGEILAGSNVTKIVTTPLPDKLHSKINKLIKQNSITFIDLDLESVAIQNRIAEADIGISTAELGIASMGTLVEVTTEDSYRLVSSLPRIHVAFVWAKEIVNDLDDAVPHLQKFYQKHLEHCHITFISGPSRTADIEMKLFLGVHGPQESHVIVCNW